jgi:hypothetical protein
MLKITALLAPIIWTAAAHAQLPVDQVKTEPVRLNDPLKQSFRANETTVDDQTDVAVTIYNRDLALVRDTRKITLFPGEISLAFMDVAQRIKPETVSLRSVSQPGALRILEQNYEYDLMSPQKLMEKFVGKDVRLVNFSNQLGFNEVDAKLLSMNQGPIYEIDGKIYLGHPGNVVLPEIPENLIAKPSLIWLLDNRGTDQEVEVTYLTNGMSWKSDYILTYDEEAGAMAVDAWVTLANQSGTSYKNAQLKLVAGDVNVASQYPQAAEMKMMRSAMASDAVLVEEGFAEYHLYTLPRRTTVKENQSKQVSLFNASGVRVAKRYEFRGAGNYYSQRIPQFGPEKVGVYLEFENEKENHLGVPLPAGVMRIYERDSDGALQFSGEDRIQHTPKDETVRLRMGNAFDVVGERVQTDFRRISNRVAESSYKITLRNHKESDVLIDVVEPMPGDWEMIRSSHDYDKRDARTAVFAIPVPADGTVELTYRVQMRW